MIARGLAIVSIITGLLAPATAQERVIVGTERLVSNGALFLAAIQGYFKAEGLDVEIMDFRGPRPVVEAVAASAADFGLAAFTPAAFNLAGGGTIKAIAAQVREKSDYEGNEVLASNAAYDKGLRRFEDLANKVVAIVSLGSSFHYQLGQIASRKGFDLAGVTLKPFFSLDAVARAVADGQVDAAILPAQYARELLTASQAKLVGWYSEIDEQQLGALFTSAKMIETRRPIVEKFMRAYRRAAAEYATALLRRDRYHKHVSDSSSQGAAAMIARYVYPGQGGAAATVEANVYFMDAQAGLDAADISRQVEWYKAQGLVEQSVDARAVMDLSFIK
jgi:NitT/TauT family transport system substrate-binding protein